MTFRWNPSSNCCCNRLSSNWTSKKESLSNIAIKDIEHMNLIEHLNSFCRHFQFKRMP